MKALGFIETNGFVAATEAADSALKAANVSLAGQYRPGSGLVAVIITGDVAAVKAAVEAGAASAATIGRLGVNGQAFTQEPHPMQRSRSTIRTLPNWELACNAFTGLTGQAPTHNGVSHCLHWAIFTSSGNGSKEFCMICILDSDGFATPS